MRLKSLGMAPRLANARPPSSAKFANAPPPGLTWRANAPQWAAGEGLGASGIDRCITLTLILLNGVRLWFPHSDKNCYS